MAAMFHQSVRSQALVPPPPQTIQGTINDPVPAIAPNPMHGSYHWTFERALSLGMVPLTVAPFIGGALSPVLDAAFCSVLLLHCHIGFDACITDYFPRKQVPNLEKFMVWLLRGCTVLVGVGLFEFETNDIGITGAVAKIWKS